jgi:hypothetical protein
MTNGDPLAELMIDATEVDRARIAAALKGRIAIDRATASAVPQPQFNDWDADQKILAYLLARKAAALLGVATDEAAMPQVVTAHTGLPAGTVRPKLRAFLESRRVSQTNAGAYFLAAPQVTHAIDALAKSRGGVEKARPAGSQTKQSRKQRAGQRSDSQAKSKDGVRSPERGIERPGRTGGRSPRLLVLELLSHGFFDSPKTLADVQKRLKDKAGHSIPVTTLSPLFTRLLRSHTLDREESDAGVYAYEKHKG